MSRWFSMTPVKARAVYFWRTAKDAFQYSSPYVQRILLAATLIAIGLWFALTPDWTSIDDLAAHSRMATREVWSSAYLIVGLLSLWRLLDPTPRILLGMAINAAGCFLLVTSSILLWMSGSPAASLGAYAAVNSIWLTIRTGATNLDQARA